MSCPVASFSHFTVADFPEDIFLLVLDGLDAWDVVCCQKVSRSWRDAFSRSFYIRTVLKKYPRARRDCLKDCPSHGDAEDSRNLAEFAAIASRYYHLRCGRARSIERYRLQPLDQRGQWHPIGQWDYHESQPGGRLYYEKAATHLTRLGNKPYLFRPTFWSYDDGFIACAVRQEGSSDEGSAATDTTLYVVDLQTSQQIPVPFRISRRVLRNITLRNRTLVIEWAEKEAFHSLNDSERVHRHFATCYDIKSTIDKSTWRVVFRNEWKMHFLGLPLNYRDRFFSIHDGRHYAVYLWQPNRSMYTGDEDLPIESLRVWDISIPSPYQPSLDVADKNRPAEDQRPHPVSVFSFRELDFLGVRQHSNISLMNLELDSEMCTISIRENICVAGQGYFDPAERLMCSTTTTIPFVGFGPAHCQRWDEDLPPYRGHCSMESSSVEDLEKWFLPIVDVYDATADVRFSLVETCFTGMSAENRLVVRIKCLDEWTTLKDELVKEVSQMGRICGDERWLIGQNASMELVVLRF